MNLEEERYRSVVELDLEQPGAARTLGGWLKDPSWRVRKAAAERIARAPERDEALKVLLGTLAERDDTGARNAAAEALARMGPWAAGPVTALLKHPDPDQRKFAAEILGQLGLTSAEGPLVAALADPDPNVRAAAAEALGRVGGHEAIRGLQAVLAQPDPLLQLCALDALAALDGPPPLPLLAPLFDKPALRAAAYRLAAHLGDAAAAEVAARGLRGESDAVRRAALGALGILWPRWPADRRGELEAVLRPHLRGLADPTALVREALLDESLEVRRGALVLATLLGDDQPVAEVAAAAAEASLAPVAALALGRLSSKLARALVVELPAVTLTSRAVVAEALLPMAEPSWVPALLEVLHSDDPELHLFAVRALGRTGAAEAVPLLLESLDDPGAAHAAARGLVALAAAHREAVAHGLQARLAAQPSSTGVLAYAEIARAGALPLLEKLRRDPDPALRAAAVEGAARAGHGEEAARGALSDEAAEVRAAAARAAARIGADSAGPLLRLALGDREAAVRLAALDAAAEAGATAVVPELERCSGDEDGQVAAHAVRALARLGALRADVLRAAIGHRDPEVIKEALHGAAPLKDAEPLALGLLDHPRWDVRAAAARVLATAGSAAAIPQVRTALASEADPIVREALAETARVLGRR